MPVRVPCRQSPRWESNPRFRHTKTAGSRYNTGAFHRAPSGSRTHTSAMARRQAAVTSWARLRSRASGGTRTRDATVGRWHVAATPRTHPTIPVGPGGLEPPPAGLRGPDAAASTLIPFPAPENATGRGFWSPGRRADRDPSRGSSGIARGTELRREGAEGGNRQAFQVARVPAGHGNCVTLFADQRFTVFPGPATAAVAVHVEIDAGHKRWFAPESGILAGIGSVIVPQPHR